MHRIAVLSDIHGNLPALEAVEADLRAQSPDEVWCGGDLAWGAPWAAECIAKVREAGWTTVKGNTDVWITGDPQTVDSERERAEVKAIAEAHALADHDAQWLLNLPIGHTGPGGILLVHGTPQSPFDAPMPDAPASAFAPYEGPASFIIYGHVHRAFMRRLAPGTIVCNPGSVGLPKDADTASYMLLTQDGPDITVVHRRVDFDRRAALERARERGGRVGELFVEFLGAG
jgi:putative phosphoesterase